MTAPMPTDAHIDRMLRVHALWDELRSDEPPDDDWWKNAPFIADDGDDAIRF